MVKYFCLSDIHGYATILKKSLKEKGFDINNPNHKIIICGDLLDRGPEARKLINFLLSIPKDRLILIKGNHEDLFDDCLAQIKAHKYVSDYHWHNKTLDTISQILGINIFDLGAGYYEVGDLDNIYLKKYYRLRKRCLNFYELKDYIFVHGWIPCHNDDLPTDYIKNESCEYKSDWRNCSDLEWYDARWINGIQMAFMNLNKTNKKIVVGHWHCSLAWALSNPKKYSEFGDNACFDIYEDNKLIALDTCTPRTNKINILIITEEM